MWYRYTLRFALTAMSKRRRRSRSLPFPDWSLRRGQIPTTPKVIVLAAVVGVAAGYGAVLFTLLIDWITAWTVELFVAEDGVWWKKSRYVWFQRQDYCSFPGSRAALLPRHRGTECQK